MADAVMSGSIGDTHSVQLERLLASGDFAHLTITSNTSRWNVHKAIICPKSSYFEKACKPPFKEAASNQIHIDDIPDPSIKMMLSFLYTSQYTADDAIIPYLQTQVQMYALGDRFGIATLKAYAESQFRQKLISRTPTFQWLLKVVPLAYSTTPNCDRGIRNAILSAIIKYMPQSKSGNQVPLPEADHDALANVIEESTSFAIDLIIAQREYSMQLEVRIDNAKKEVKRLCDDCNPDYDVYDSDHDSCYDELFCERCDMIFKRLKGREWKLILGTDK